MRTSLSLLLSLSLLAWAAPARASLTDDFKNQARPELLKPFALDLGGVLGAASTDPGVSLGFPGFEAGIVSGMQFRPDRDDLILRNSGVKAFGVPMIQGAVGLPLGVSVVAHGMTYSGASIFGGGVRYSLFKPGLATKMFPSVGLSFFADKVNAPAFSLLHYAANASAGLSLPLVTPFASVGYDLTKVSVGAATFAGVAGQSAWARGTRVAVGADLTPFPFMRLRGAYQMLHGLPGATLDLLFKF